MSRVEDSWRGRVCNWRGVCVVSYLQAASEGGCSRHIYPQSRKGFRKGNVSMSQHTHTHTHLSLISVSSYIGDICSQSHSIGVSFRNFVLDAINRAFNWDGLVSVACKRVNCGIRANRAVWCRLPKPIKWQFKYLFTKGFGAINCRQCWVNCF